MDSDLVGLSLMGSVIVVQTTIAARETWFSYQLEPEVGYTPTVKLTDFRKL